MRRVRAWCVRLIGLLTRRRVERELALELESHLDMLVEDNLRSGMSAAEARRKALIELGGVESVKEQCRDAYRLTVLETRLTDLRHALRATGRSPVFSLVVILSLGIALGASTAILNLAHELFFRALPIHDPEQVVAIYSTQPDLGDGTPLSFLNWTDVRAQSRALAEVAGYEWTSLPVTLERATTRFPAQLASGNYFRTLGVSAMLGRTFSESADRIPGADLEVVISHHFWQQALGGDRSAIGRPLRIAGQPFTVVGVTPPEFRGLDIGLQVALWIPFGVYRQIYPETDWIWYESRREVLVYGIGRLEAGTSLAQARAELAGIATTLEAAHPEFNENRGIQALPIAEATIFPWARPFVRNGVLLLAGAVVLTLLIAAVNVANLFLLRARERGREVAIRLALGVSRGALAARLLTESVVLSLLGGTAGIGFLALTQMALKHVVAVVPSPTAGPYALRLELEPMALVVTFGLSVALGLGLGLFPVLASSRAGSGSGEALRARGDVLSSSEGRGRFSLRSGLLVTQLALSLVALFGGAFFFRSLHQIRDLDPGFERSRLGFLRVDLSVLELEPRDNVAGLVRERIVTAVAHLPGVDAVGVTPRRPMDGGWKRLMAPAEVAADPTRRISPYTDNVDGAFFDAMDLSLLEGRTFNREDERGAPRVAIVNALLAKRLWPGPGPGAGQNAVGRSLVLFDLAGETPLEIIGVVEDSKYRRVTESPEGYVYMPLASDHAGFLTLAIRTSGDPESVLGAAQAELRRLEPRIPILSVETVTGVLSQSMWGPRLAAAFLGLFAFIALLLSAVGIYGVISHDVNRRTRELCIRTAVGAQNIDIMGLVLGQCGKHYLLGALFGIPCAYVASRWVSHLIFVDLLDPYAVLGGLLPLVAVGLLASWIPARRATALDPNEVLRSE